MQFRFILGLTLCSTALSGPIVQRDLQTINDAFINIQKSLAALDTDTKAITGKTEDITKVSSDADMITQVLTDSTTKVEATEPITLNDTIGLQTTASGLGTQAMTTISDILAKKDVIRMIPGSKDVVIQSLKNNQAATVKFTATVVSKVPAVGQDIAKQQTDQINASFDMLIKAFSE